MIKMKKQLKNSEIVLSEQDIHDLIEPNICVNEDNSKSLENMHIEYSEKVEKIIKKYTQYAFFITFVTCFIFAAFMNFFGPEYVTKNSLFAGSFLFTLTTYTIASGVFAIIIALIIAPLLCEMQLKRVMKNHTQGKENKIINIELFLRNMFFSRYGKQFKETKIIDEKIINYVLENLNEKSMSYREFLELNLDDKYTEIKEKYVQLKSKKDELNLLKD
jgi:hypothetical protein